MNWTAIGWFVLTLVFIFVEANTVAMVSAWFAAGSIAAMLTSFLGGPIWLQAVVFLAVSAGLLLLLRPMVRKHFTPHLTKTNVDSVIGSTGLVTVEIQNNISSGQVKLGAMEWSARSTSGAVIPVGTLIKVDKIEGVKVYVSLAEETVNI